MIKMCGKYFNKILFQERIIKFNFKIINLDICIDIVMVRTYCQQLHSFSVIYSSHALSLRP